MDDGVEKIVDRTELQMVRRQGRRVVASVISTAALATGLLLLPGVN
jgi:hypothetical protein